MRPLLMLGKLQFSYFLESCNSSEPTMQRTLPRRIDTQSVMLLAFGKRASYATSTKINHEPLLIKKDQVNVPKTNAVRIQTRFVPEKRDPFTSVESFLEALGRGLSSHSSKFTSWGDFFLADSHRMETLGIPVRERRYIIRWQRKYR